MSDNQVWADGLLVFYEIFRFLEQNAPSTHLPLEYHRTAAFERDLDFYLGPNWKRKYVPRESVAKYLNHLREVKDKNPILLLAYIYHLYMGLLSGGQILQKKRQLWFSSKNDMGGENVTKFDSAIGDLKSNMRSLVDKLAETFDEKTKSELIAESIKCFELNNEIVRSVNGVNVVGAQKFFQFLIILLALLYVYIFLL